MDIDLDKLREGLAAQNALPLALLDVLIEKGVISSGEFGAAYDRRTAELRDHMGGGGDVSGP